MYVTCTRIPRLIEAWRNMTQFSPKCKANLLLVWNFNLFDHTTLSRCFRSRCFSYSFFYFWIIWGSSYRTHKVVNFSPYTHQAHVSNNDRQEVGRYLQKWYFRTVTVSWVEEQNAEVKEKLYMDIVSILQGRTPILNKTSGNSKKAQKKTLFQRIFKWWTIQKSKNLFICCVFIH